MDAKNQVFLLTKKQVPVMFEVMTVFEASIKLYGWFSENDLKSIKNQYESMQKALKRSKKSACGEQTTKKA